MGALKPLLFLVVGLAAGACLAGSALATGFPTGWIGALALVGWAVVMRRRWDRQEARDTDPGAPERVLWLRLAGVALILGHAAAALLLTGDDLRLGNGNALAVNGWVMLAALPVAALIFRRDRGARDERHAPIAARGVRAGYGALIVLLTVLAFWLAFAPPPFRAALSHFVLANMLIGLMLASYLAMLIVQLAAYGRDAEAPPDAWPE